MKQILAQYFASLKERGELDVILPDLLSDHGFTIYSRPQTGAKQHGVDVAAIGLDFETKKKTLYLITIKSGNLTRSNWDSGKTAVRQSVNEILDTQLPLYELHHRGKTPIKIVICVGGEVKQDVNYQVEGFRNKNSNNNISVDIWNGDCLADMYLSSKLMNETIFTKQKKNIVRKVIATIDEPEFCVFNFSKLVEMVFKEEANQNKEFLQSVRIVYLAIGLIDTVCKESDNIEAAYRCVTLASLYLWQSCNRPSLSKGYREELFVLWNELMDLYASISLEYVDKHIIPYCFSTDLLASSVGPGSSVDVNLKLFEALGRLSLTGLWLYREKKLVDKGTEKYRYIENKISAISQSLVSMIRNNPVFFSPSRDDHAIEIVIASLFLEKSHNKEFLKCWLGRIVELSIFSYREELAYPCILTDYRQLAIHPVPGNTYREKVTRASILYPTLGVLLAGVDDSEAFDTLKKFYLEEMSHSTWQLWIPDELTEQHLYRNSALHGLCICDLNLNSPNELFEQVRNEALMHQNSFKEISAVNQECWPIVLMACSLYRVPVPVQFMVFER